MKKATYNVYVASKNVVISLDGYDPTPEEGYQKVGSFEFGADPETNQTSSGGLTANNGDHAFVAEAKRILAEGGHNVETGNYVFQDRASNSPLHDEENYSTDDLPVVDEGHDPNVSSQAGGETSTDPEVDQTELKPNGVEPADTREDEGEGTSQGESATDQRTEEEKRDEPKVGSTDTMPEQEPSKPAGNQEGETEISEESEDTDDKEIDPSDMSVEDLKAHIANVEDKEELERIYKLEQSGKERTTALKAIEDRANELESAE